MNSYKYTPGRDKYNCKEHSDLYVTVRSDKVSGFELSVFYITFYLPRFHVPFWLNQSVFILLIRGML